jgi:hypothetical protein
MPKFAIPTRTGEENLVFSSNKHNALTTDVASARKLTLLQLAPKSLPRESKSDRTPISRTYNQVGEHSRKGFLSFHLIVPSAGPMVAVAD